MYIDYMLSRATKGRIKTIDEKLQDAQKATANREERKKEWLRLAQVLEEVDKH